MSDVVMGFLQDQLSLRRPRGRSQNAVRPDAPAAEPPEQDARFEDLVEEPATGFDRWVNGLNRLPRPLLAFGTIALIGYAMTDPQAFAQRMAGLKAMPEPLWWLMGAVVAFYFGAREAHYRRKTAASRPAPTEPPPRQDDGNPALDDWRASAE